MSYLRHLWFMYRLRRKVQAAGYGVEVLYAGWVDLPAALRERGNRLP
jgi:hypothetical protein